MIAPLIRYTAFGTLGVGGLFALKENEWNPKDVGVVRFGRAFVTAAKIAADYKFSLRGYDDCSDPSLKAWSDCHRRSATRLLELCCKNGGIFIKVGQHIAALQYLVPPEYVETLSVLHNRAPRTKFEDIKQVIKEDLKADLEDLFDDFELEPVGAASFAQVHKAKLKSTGQLVAVKVQHPKVQKHSYVDMTTMDIMVQIIAKLFPNFSFLWLAESTKKNIPQELDFRHEGRNADKTRRLLEHFDWLKIPKIHWEFSSSRILLMDFVTGGMINDTKFIEDEKIDKQQLTRRLGSLYCDMIFKHGHVHCDPHPGNILVNNSENGAEITLLDHGLYAELTNEFRSKYSNLWLALIQANMESIKKHATELGVGDFYGVLACVVSGRPWSAVVRGITEHIDKKAMQSEESEIKSYASRYMYEINQLLSNVPRELLLILKTNDLLRSIETRMGTKGQQMSFIIMTRYCSENVHTTLLEKCQDWRCRFRVKSAYNWIDFKLKVYQLYLWMKWYFTRTHPLALQDVI
uniref:Putative aarF domain-containing protein kinase 1 n=1 Tax=Aceria tosichella TaxID=561515 RepID=A0A6G1SCL8_9ACAR